MKKKEVSSAAAFLGSRGGKKAAANMTSKERSERAKKGALAKWAKKEEEKSK